jgi:hypothetical protein
MVATKITEFNTLGAMIRTRYNTWISLKKYDNEIDKKISNAIIKELKYLLKFYEDNK